MGLTGARAIAEKASPGMETTFLVSTNAIFLAHELKTWVHRRPWLSIPNGSSGHVILWPDPFHDHSSISHCLFQVFAFKKKISFIVKYNPHISQ